MSFALNQFSGFSTPANTGFSGPSSDADWNFAADRSLTDSIAGATFVLTRVQTGNATHFDSVGDMVNAAANAARWQYDPLTGESMGLHLGGHTANQQPYSEDVGYTGGGAWAQTQVSRTANSTDFLGRGSVAALIKPSMTSGLHWVKGSANNIGTATGEVGNGFMYFKSAYYNNVKFRYQSGSGASFEFFFDTDDGTIGDTAGTAPLAYGVRELPDGWWMAYIMATTVTNQASYIAAYVATGNSTGDDSFSPASASEGIYMAGGQNTDHAILSSGSESNHIPQYTGPTTTSGHSTEEDVCEVSLGGWFNNTEGTILVEYHQWEGENLYHFYPFTITPTIGNSATAIWARSIHNPTVPYGQGFIANSGAQMTESLVAGPVEQTAGVRKTAIAYKLNDSQFAHGGLASPVDTVCTIPTVTTLQLNSAGLATQFRGASTISRVRYWNTRLTEAQLIELTTV